MRPHPRSPAGVLELQRQAGNQAVSQLMLQRDATGAPAPGLTADRFKGSPKLEKVFANRGGARLGVGDPDRDATARVQAALLDLPAKTGNDYDLGPKGADGHYGQKTASAIKKFKADEALGSTQFGDVGPGTMRRLDQLFVADGPQPKPKPTPGPKEENELLAALFHNRELEQLFDKIVLQFGKMMRQQGAGLTEVEQDLSAEKQETPFFARMLIFAAEESIGAALGGVAKFAVGESLMGIVELAVKTAGAAGGEELEKTVKETFKAAIKGGKDVIKETISPSGLATQPLSKFIDSQHNGLIDANNKKTEKFFEKKNGAGGADQGLRTFTDEDKAEILATAPAVHDPRVDRAQELLDGYVKATAEARGLQYRAAMKAWTMLNAQMATDQDAGNVRGAVTNPFAILTADSNEVPGVLEVGIDFVPATPKRPVSATNLSIRGLGKAAREKITNRHGDETLGSLFSVIRVKGNRGGVELNLVKTEENRPQGLLNMSQESLRYLKDKDDGDSGAGSRLLFEEVEKHTIKGVTGRLDGPD